jgi:hypothetical protein
MGGNPTLNKLIRQTIYDLKKRYGAKITVYRLTTAATDYETGVKTATKDSLDVQRAAVLPSSEARRFLTSISFISASKSFVSPGMQGWDQSQRGFILDARDCPGWEFEPEDWIVYRDRRYDIVTTERLEFDTGWLVIGKEAKGSVPEQDIRINVVDTLDLQQDESEVVE